MCILETERLVVRDWELSDCEALRPLIRDARVLRYISPNEPWPDERIRGFVEQAMRLRESRGWILWPVIHREDGLLIGTCGFWHTFLPDIEIGYRLHPDYWGWGKALYEIVIDKGFGEFGFESITSLFPPSRTRVKGILRLGFEPDGGEWIGEQRFNRYRLGRSGKGTGAL